jgi:hypothetical protein
MTSRRLASTTFALTGQISSPLMRISFARLAESEQPEGWIVYGFAPLE